MKTIIYFIIISLFISSCNNKKDKQISYSLDKTDESLIFPLENDTKNNAFFFTVYNDYFVLQNPLNNTLLFYSIKKRKLEFKTKMTMDGADGVGITLGFYLHNLDSIYVTNRDIQEISLIDRFGKLKDKYSYEKDKNSNSLSLFNFGSAYYQPAQVIDRLLYIYSGPNRFIENDPISITLNMDNKEVKSLPFNYPNYPGSECKLKKYGMETLFSRCYDGKHFIYSFYFDENIYVTNPSHEVIKQIPIKSKYIKRVQLPDELKATPEDFCQNALYGNLLYDKYRNVYYRIAYPASEIEKKIRPAELDMYGRKNFSIIILDKDLNKIGETKFPDYTYNSRVILILKDGLYISNSHYLNPKFDDNVLSFKKFKLSENKF